MKRILYDKYEVLELIGCGGAGKVYLARDMHLERLVVIKESREELLLTEIDLLKELIHPGLPLIYDCFRQKISLEDDSRQENAVHENPLQEKTFQERSFQEKTFLVMEYIEGMNLRNYLDKHDRVPEGQAIKWAMELCGILDYLHGRHPAVIYRDLKPENIMIRQDGSLKLIDFGGALQYACGSGREAMCAGTAGYAPKEQWRQTKGDVTWDIYGMGVVLHEMLTGVNPNHPPYGRLSVREYDRSLSKVWDRIISTCTAEEPSGRYQSAEQLLLELQKLRQSGWERLKEGLLRRRCQSSLLLDFLARFWQELKHFIILLSGVYTAFCFVLPLIRGIPETSIPFPYLEKPLFFLMITLILYLLFYGNRRKRKILRHQEKNIWLTEKKFSGLISLLLLLTGLASMAIFPGFAIPEVYAGGQMESLWVEMRDDQGRKMLLKEDAVYVTDDKVRFELPAKRLPGQELALRLVAVGEDGTAYSSRIFYIRAETEAETEERDLN